MFRSIHRVLFCALVALLSALPAQEMTKETFFTELGKGIELADEKIIDKVMRRGAYHALNLYEALYDDMQAQKPDALARGQAMSASWKRCFSGSDTMEQLDRWMSGATTSVRQQLQNGRNQSFKLWTHYTDVVSKTMNKADFERVVQQFMDLARNAESIGHNMEVAELWNFATVVATKVPEMTLTNRRDAVFSMEQFMDARKRWNFAFDDHYMRSLEYCKSEKLKIAEAEKAGDKRKDEGYAADTKGIEALVMPNVAEEKHVLKFEPLPNWDELDYGAKGGPVPPFWWMVSTEKVGSSSRQLDWFRAKNLFLHRTAAAKFAIGFDPSYTKTAVEIDASTKGKVSTFWLDVEKKKPYAMVFWTGSDREMVNEAECNLAPGDTVGNVYYRSASSWKAQIGADTLVFYDDSADGTPCGSKPFDPPFHSPTQGQHDSEVGTPTPLLDSMRVGKGPRMPHSEFVKLSTGWVHLKKGAGDDVGVRPLNPEYVKLGKAKLTWSGPKPTIPVQLVVQGRGDLATAFFDIAGGKEVELPAGEYEVIWGRILVGKGTRAQMASIYRGNSKPFTVEAGKVFDLKMGAPFVLQFNRRGDENSTLDALKILLTEASGCVLAELHGISLACEVLAAKEADGKGTKVVGKFVRFTDPELVNNAAKKHNNLMQLTACFPMPDGYRADELILKVKLPTAGMKLQLSIKKHALFGPVNSIWQ